jgi:hypothetical protein
MRYHRWNLETIEFYVYTPSKYYLEEGKKERINALVF